MLANRPNFHEIESKWQKYWQDRQIFKFDTKSKKPTYTIDTPPPTASGQLHLGHSMSYTHFDIIARYKRLRGFNVFLPIGFDDNGHPSERYVEKKYKIKSKDMPREKFNKLVDDEIKVVEEGFRRDSIRLGLSYDWDTLYRTISDYCAKTSQKSFLDLHKKGLAYRAEEPTIWCPSCITAQANADVEDEKRTTMLNYIDFDAGGKCLQIATTRPELLPACVAIVVNPKDKRYKQYVGKLATVPLFNREVKVIADSKVDQKFGTGAVMVCTFGDSIDIEWWKKYKLPLRIVLTEDGKLNVGKYKGQPIKEARENIVKDLGTKLKKQETVEQTVGVCWRCHTPLEFLITRQWFIELIKNKKKFLELGRKVKWHPNFYRARYENWVENIKWNWIISRQRYFGIPIPVWYCKKCGKGILPDEKDLPVNPLKDKPKTKCACGGADFIPDEDVFDTWMTSSMSPELALGWVNSDPKMKLIPEDMHPSAHDIIRTWAFYLIVKHWYHFKKLPWKNFMVSGHALDPRGRAMHKSLGNVIPPMEIVDKYCADALRYWTVTAEVGDDVSFQDKEVNRGMYVLTKLWNTARFFETWKESCKDIGKLAIEDKWVLSRMAQTTKRYVEAMDAYRPGKARKEVEMFFLHEFCDFYLEMVKHRMYSSKQSQINPAAWTLYQCFFQVLKLWSPIIPHITEEIYQELFKPYCGKDSISQLELEKFKTYLSAVDLGELATEVISLIRKYKQERGMSMGAEIETIIVEHSAPDKIKQIESLIKGTMRVKELKVRKTTSDSVRVV